MLATRRGGCSCPGAISPRGVSMNGRPFPLPEDLGLKRTRPCVHLFRAAASVVRSAVERGTTPEMVARKLFGRTDEPTQILLRAASNPAETTATGWAAEIAQHA